MTDVANFNGQSRGEEIANAVSHGIGAALAVAGMVVLLVFSIKSNITINIISSLIYGVSLVFLYMMSTLYHAFSKENIKRIFQKLDHCSIFVLIVGCYAVVCLSLLGGKLGLILFGINLFCATAGIIANAISVEKWHKVSLVLYILMGWSVVFAIKPVLALVSFKGFVLLLAGGLCYSIGVIFYKAKKPRYMHSIWHLFVLAGSIFHYFFFLFYVIA